jgi:hypothetical protein
MMSQDYILMFHRKEVPITPFSLGVCFCQVFILCFSYNYVLGENTEYDPEGF